MALCLGPTDTFEVEIEGTGARFDFLYMTISELRAFTAISRDRERLSKLNTLEQMDLLVPAIREKLVGWTGLVDAGGAEVPFDPERIEDLFSVDNLWRIYHLEKYQVTLTDEDKKKSDSPSPIDTEKSVPAAAPPRGATVEIDRLEVGPPSTTAPDAKGPDAPGAPAKGN